MAENSKIAIWTRVVDPSGNGMTPDVARYVVGLDFPPHDHERVEELNRRAQDGTLTAEETAELDNFLLIADLLAVVQAKAQNVLRKVGATS